jgi:hypothetical protein
VGNPGEIVVFGAAAVIGAVRRWLCLASIARPARSVAQPFLGFVSLIPGMQFRRLAEPR